MMQVPKSEESAVRYGFHRDQLTERSSALFTWSICDPVFTLSHGFSPHVTFQLSISVDRHRATPYVVPAFLGETVP